MDEANRSEPVPRRRLIRTAGADPAREGDPFRPLEPQCRVVQFSQPLSPDELRRTGALFAGRRDVELYVHGAASRDLDFLHAFPEVRKLHVALYDLQDVEGFQALGGRLEAFTFSRTRRRFSLGFLAEAQRLEQLFLAGHDKDLAAIGGLVGVRDLGLSGLTLPGLSMFAGLTRLERLKVFLGGTRDLASLPQFGRLEDLWLMRITGLADLAVLADLPSLTTLRLDWMRNVTALPSFAPLGRLTEVVLDTMKGLTDLGPVAAAPALRRLEVANMPQLAPASFAGFQGHPSLERLRVGTGRVTVDEAVRAMFPGLAE
jgi:hypothetical protein